MEEKQREQQLIHQLTQLYESQDQYAWNALLHQALCYVSKALGAESGFLWMEARDAARLTTICTYAAQKADFQTLLEMRSKLPSPPHGLVSIEIQEVKFWLLNAPFRSPIPLARLAFQGTVTSLSEVMLAEATAILASICHHAQVQQITAQYAQDIESHWTQRYAQLNMTLDKISQARTLKVALFHLQQAALILLRADKAALLYQDLPAHASKVLEIGDEECLRLLKRLGSSASASDSKFIEAVIHIADAWEAPNIATEAQNGHVHTILALPIQSHVQATGALLLCRHDVSAFSQQKRMFARSLIHQATLAMHNTQLIRQEQEQRQLAEAMTQVSKALTQSLDLNKVLDEILAQLDNVVPHDASNVMFIEDNKAHVVRRHGYRQFVTDANIKDDVTLPLDLPNIQKMIEERAPSLIAQTTESELWTETESSAWARSHISAPIIIGDEVVGFVNVDSAMPGFFNERHVQRLEMFTDYVALAVQNARLFQESQQRQHYLEELNAVTATVISTLHLNDILQKGLEQALKIVKFHYGAIYLWNEDARTLDLNVHAGLSATIRNAFNIFHPGEGLIGTAFMNSQPEITSCGEMSASSDTETSDFQIAIPLVLENRTLGVMGMGTEIFHAPTAAVLAHLQTISDQLALAVRREQLSQQLQEQLQSLQYLYETSTGLMTQMNMESAVFIILRTLHDILPRTLATAFYTYHNDEWQRAKVYTQQQASTLNTFWKSGKIGDDETAFLQSCRRDRMPIIVSDRHGKSMPFWEQARQAGVRQLFYMPLALPTGELFGVIGMMTTDKRHVSTQRSALIQALLQEGAAAMSRIRLYEQSRREERQMRAMLESSQDGIFLIGNDRRVRYVNKRALELLNLTGHRGHWEKRSFSDVIRSVREEAPGLAQWLAEQITTTQLAPQPSKQKDTTITFETNQKRQLTPHYHHVYSLQEKPLGVLILIHDVTEQKALERMRDDLLNMLVHDMRNPISVVINALQLMKDPNMHDISDEVNALALSNAEQVLTLVNAILDINKLEAGQFNIQPRSSSLSELLNYLDKHVLVVKKDIVIRHLIPETVPQVFIDPDLMKRVFQNLIDNALKFVPEDKGKIRISARADDAYVEVEVFNNGPPIPPDVKDQLFDKFTTGVYQGRGYGLGLAFCRLAVEAHGGEIWAKNHPEGVSFFFTLPMAD